MLNSIADVIKGLVKREAARLIAYSGAAATAGALLVAAKLGVELSEAFLVGVAAFAVALSTEAIRVFVYSTKAVQEIADNAAATGSTDIGSPPKGE